MFQLANRLTRQIAVPRRSNNVCCKANVNLRWDRAGNQSLGKRLELSIDLRRVEFPSRSPACPTLQLQRLMLGVSRLGQVGLTQ